MKKYLIFFIIVAILLTLVLANNTTKDGYNSHNPSEEEIKEYIEKLRADNEGISDNEITKKIQEFEGNERLKNSAKSAFTFSGIIFGILILKYFYKLIFYKEYMGGGFGQEKYPLNSLKSGLEIFFKGRI